MQRPPDASWRRPGSRRRSRPRPSPSPPPLDLRCAAEWPKRFQAVRTAQSTAHLLTTLRRPRMTLPHNSLILQTFSMASVLRTEGIVDDMDTDMKGERHEPRHDSTDPLLAGPGGGHVSGRPRGAAGPRERGVPTRRGQAMITHAMAAGWPFAGLPAVFAPGDIVARRRRGVTARVG